MKPRRPISCDARGIVALRTGPPRGRGAGFVLAAPRRVGCRLLTAALMLASLFGAVAAPGARAQGEPDGVGRDRAITEDVRKRFAENREVDASTIRVETLDGVVVLHGYASSDAARTAAAVTARRVASVKRVRNEIHVRP